MRYSREKRKIIFSNKNGFTLIEILAAVTILGILTAIAIVSVTKLIEKAKKEHYETVEKNVISAAQSYAQQNRKALPKTIGQKTKIYLNTLVDNKFIDNVVDYSKKECDLENSYVQIFKYSQKDYSYVVYLKCPSYNNSETINNTSPKITLEFNEEEALISQPAQANITILGSEEEDISLMSYSYIIYKDGKEVKNTGNISATGRKRLEIKNISLEDYTPGLIKMAISATNIYGNTTTITKKSDFKDTKKPTCIIEEEDKTSSPKDWINQDRKITIKCDDGAGTGCVRDEYSKTFKTTMRNGKIRITDNAGNYRDCNVSVYIDKTPPTVPTVTMYKWNNNNTTPTSASGLSEYESGWINKNIYVVPSDSEDEHVGEFVYQYKKSSDTTEYREAPNTNITEEGTSTIQWRACDILGNCSEYSTAKTINLDKTAPTVPQVKMYKWTNNSTRPTSNSGLTTYSSGTWSKINIYTEATGSTDTLSRVKEYKFTTTGKTENKTNSVAVYRNIEEEGISYIKWKACDNAGNCSAYSARQTIKIDKTKPSCGTITGGSTTWTKNNRTVSVDCSDSGSECVRSSYSKSYSSRTTKTDKITIKDNSGNTRKCSVNVYVDKEAPNAPTDGAIGAVSGSNRSASIKTASSNTTDVNNGSGFKEIRYVIKTTNTPPSASEFTSTSTSYTRACGQTNYAWAAAVDKVGNVSDAKSLGHSSDAASSYSSWGRCSKACGGGTQTRTNTCALETTELSRSCNPEACCSSTEKANCTSWKWSSCTKECGGGTKYESRKCDLVSTYDNSIVCTSQKEEKRNQNTSCNTQSCFSCDIADATLFGTSMGSINGNHGAWTDANSTWGNWCHSNGTWCYAVGGFDRYCIDESCNGLNGTEKVTARWLNENKGCEYAKYWCSC